MDSEILQDRVIDPKDIKVKIAGVSNRKIDPKLEEIARKEWQEILEKARTSGMHPWDGTFYRLDNLDQVRNGALEFILSTVKYSQLRAFQKLKVSENYPDEFHTNHLGTLGIVRTSDGYYVFGFREKSLNSTKITFIGGGLQQDEMEVSSGEDIERNMLKELKEEINVDKDSVNKIQIIKLVRGIERMNIFILFNLELDLTKDQVLDLYNKLEDKEHDKLIFVTKDELTEFSGELPDFMKLSLQHITEA